MIPDDYKETYGHERFLIYDKRKSVYGGRLFASVKQLKVLFHSEILFADGTFKVAPKLFEQFYVIHGLENGEGRCIYIFIYTFFFCCGLYQLVHEREEITAGREIERRRKVKRDRIEYMYVFIYMTTVIMYAREKHD